MLNPHRGDIKRLVGAFPAYLSDDVRAAVSIIPFTNPVRLADGESHNLDFFVTEFKPQIVAMGSETIQLPYRVYFNEPDSKVIETLSDRQHILLRCIYLRHHDGHVRQKHLEHLSGVNEAFLCPFAIQLLGEYVIEILDVLEHVFSEPFVSVTAEFLNANQFFWKQTQSRMISYWNEYYRNQCPDLHQYVGKRLVDQLNEALKQRGRDQWSPRKCRL